LGEREKAVIQRWLECMKCRKIIPTTAAVKRNLGTCSTGAVRHEKQHAEQVAENGSTNTGTGTVVQVLVLVVTVPVLLAVTVVTVLP
jgi:hypothetical protein